MNAVLTGWRQTKAGGLLRGARPKQWLKNVLVFAAPGAAGVALSPSTMARLSLVFVAWCLVSSGTYFVNDILDRVADQFHPRKRYRPVAAGLVPVGVAWGMAAGLITAGLALPALVGAPAVGGLLALYTVVTVAYSLGLKDEPVIDLVAVASGFVLRAVSGGVAADVALSEWFLIVASFGSLLVVAGKRRAELVDLRDDRGAHRPTLDVYSLPFLNYIRTVSSSVAIAAYCLWAFERAEESGSAFFFQASIVPFVIAIFRYALLLEAGQGGAPEDVVLGDRALQVVALVWLAVFAGGVYLA